MQRIVIVGCGGAGKSTLARRLGEVLSLPVYHLDQLYWNPGWKPSSDEEFLRKQEAILGSGAWIIDGNFGSTMERRIRESDTVLFLDFPTLVCLAGAMRRWWRYRGRTRPDMTEGNPEKLDWEYVWWILTFRMRRRGQVFARITKWGAGKTVLRFTSRTQVDDFVKSLA